MNQSFKYLPPNKRKKILLICDDIRVHSGVATIAKEIVINTAQHFNWVQMAGAIKHPDQGKRFDLSKDTNKVSKINGVEFDWTDEHIEKRGGEDGYFVRKHDVGVIAQEVLEVLPEVVREREDNTLAVDYERMVALLIEAVKDLKKEVEELKQK